MFEIAKQSNNLFHKTMNININHCIIANLHYALFLVIKYSDFTTLVLAIPIDVYSSWWQSN